MAHHDKQFIKWMQQRLGLKVTGKDDAALHQAILAYQTSLGLSPTSTSTQETVDALRAGAKPPVHLAGTVATGQGDGVGVTITGDIPLRETGIPGGQVGFDAGDAGASISGNIPLVARKPAIVPNFVSDPNDPYMLQTTGAGAAPIWAGGNSPLADPSIDKVPPQAEFKEAVEPPFIEDPSFFDQITRAHYMLFGQAPHGQPPNATQRLLSKMELRKGLAAIKPFAAPPQHVVGPDMSAPKGDRMHIMPHFDSADPGDTFSIAPKDEGTGSVGFPWEEHSYPSIGDWIAAHAADIGFGKHKAGGGETTDPFLGASGKSYIENQDFASWLSSLGTNLQTGGLDPNFESRLVAAIRDAEHATGEPAKINDLVRTPELQAQYYANWTRHPVAYAGRTYHPQGAGGSLAAAPGHSRHQAGQAADVAHGAVLNWLHDNAANYGFEFLTGHAGKIDSVHIQLSRSPAATAKLQTMLASKGFNVSVDGVAGPQTETALNQYIGGLSQQPQPASSSSPSPTTGVDHPSSPDARMAYPDRIMQTQYSPAISDTISAFSNDQPSLGDAIEGWGNTAASAIRGAAGQPISLPAPSWMESAFTAAPKWAQPAKVKGGEDIRGLAGSLIPALQGSPMHELADEAQGVGRALGPMMRFGEDISGVHVPSFDTDTYRTASAGPSRGPQTSVAPTSFVPTPVLAYGEGDGAPFSAVLDRSPASPTSGGTRRATAPTAAPAGTDTSLARPQSDDVVNDPSTAFGFSDTPDLMNTADFSLPEVVKKIAAVAASHPRDVAHAVQAQSVNIPSDHHQIASSFLGNNYNTSFHNASMYNNGNLANTGVATSSNGYGDTVQSWTGSDGKTVSSYVDRNGNSYGTW